MADDITPLASLSLTHVYYNPTDPLSTLSAFLSLLPQALCVVYATLLWSTREAEVLLMFAGQLACEAVNFALKRLIKEERPRLVVRGGSSGGELLVKGYGMPSSHAQFAVFWAVAVSLFLCVRHRPVKAGRNVVFAAAAAKGGRSGNGENKKNGEENGGPGLGDVHRAYRTGGLAAVNASIEAYSHSHWTLAQRAVVSAGALLVAGLVAWSRVYLGYHSVRQVLAGCAAGAGCAAAWFAVTYLMRETGMVAWALEMPLARWFRIRDLVVVEDLCQAGWEKWEERRRVALERERERETAKGRKGQ
ncbi:PAP2 superfamily-domain-containing protein [Parachaetomium inaequale]|uniref:Dolichyldiphosphatase n=1 Tax=Parachaetomium inaequale TaxID=2588326 RepID=A0AAN6PD89_9PEZI|nr:PAP2 superfamily-domain-containing protein [Parachaetomium inaequale]